MIDIVLDDIELVLMISNSFVGLFIIDDGTGCVSTDSFKAEPSINERLVMSMKSFDGKLLGKGSGDRGRSYLKVTLWNPFHPI